MKTKLIAMIMAGFCATAAQAAPVQWASGVGGNDHFYEFVELQAPLAPSAIETIAESSTYAGLEGYLATITSAEEQAFLNSIWPGPGTISGQFGNYSFYLIGLSDRDVEGNFAWLGGPEEGQTATYTNWAPNEPNNNTGTGDQEDYVAAWWLDDSNGIWNDGPDVNSFYGYVVEFGPAAPVPLPAGLPLLLAGLGGFALLKRKNRVG